MSRLDQSFIKAYHKRDQQPSAPAAPAPMPAPPAAAPSAAAKLREHSRIDERHAELRAHSEPHVKLPPSGPAAKSTSAKTVNAKTPSDRLAATVVAPVGLPGKVVGPVAVAARQETAAAEPAVELRAAFEVDRFLWPEACKNLLAATTDEYRRMASELLRAGQEHRKLVLITSLHRGEGRTLLTLYLAHALAQQRARVAIMDADTGRPQLARNLKLLPQAGWDETLQAGDPVTESWIESVADGTVLVPLRNPADQRDWRVDLGKLEQTMEQLCREHDLVLVDAGPLDDLASRELMSWMTGAVHSAAAIVVRDMRSPISGALEEVEQHLTHIGIRQWSVAENFV